MCLIFWSFDVIHEGSIGYNKKKTLNHSRWIRWLAWDFYIEVCLRGGDSRGLALWVEFIAWDLSRASRLSLYSLWVACRIVFYGVQWWQMGGLGQMLAAGWKWVNLIWLQYVHFLVLKESLNYPKSENHLYSKMPLFNPKGYLEIWTSVIFFHQIILNRKYFVN